MNYGKIRVRDEFFQQINKTKAEKFFNEGREIFLLPCRANPHSIWVEMSPLSKKDGDNFKSLVNAFEYYNCDGQIGRYAVCFVKL